MWWLCCPRPRRRRAVEAAACAVCQEACSTYACKCSAMHRACAARFRREMGSTCPTCRTSLCAPSRLEARPGATPHDQQLRRVQWRVARERECEARRRARSWPRHVWPIVREVLGSRVGVRTALNRIVRDESERFVERSRDAGFDDPKATLRDVEWVERRFDLLSRRPARAPSAGVDGGAVRAVRLVTSLAGLYQMAAADVAALWERHALPRYRALRETAPRFITIRGRRFHWPTGALSEEGARRVQYAALYFLCEELIRVDDDGVHGVLLPCLCRRLQAHRKDVLAAGGGAQLHEDAFCPLAWDAAEDAVGTAVSDLVRIVADRGRAGVARELVEAYGAVRGVIDGATDVSAYPDVSFVLQCMSHHEAVGEDARRLLGLQIDLRARVRRTVAGP